MTETERLRAALERIKTLANADADGPHEIAGLFADIDSIASEALNPPADDRLALLTDRQREIFEFIKAEIEARHRAPTLREIGERFGISNTNGVHCHLRALRKKGLLSWDPDKSRTLAVVEVGA